MTTYVLVGGAWLGGWCWQGVARRLREEGNDAYPSPSPASESGCTSPLLRSTSRPTSPTW